ncbi:hypothetical protein WKH57_24975 [Niallia taxi]|uniref:hypothetical protein n=1 Tax=Niallia taxi TaxID=2499688 RepID=UPI00203A5D69|nr:hypothetical protein [Niallia taxi]MCM3216789.1 hypothetical protein [Niallia taxi]
MKKIKITLSVIFLLIISVVGLVFYKTNFENKTTPNSKAVEATAEEYGFEMEIKNNNKTSVADTLLIDKLEDTLYLNFKNNYIDGEFLFTLFYDYKQIDFKIKDLDYKGNYKFKLKKGEQISIPFKLPEEINTDEFIHKLLASVVIAPNSHEKDLKLNSDFYGMVMDYEINYQQIKTDNSIARPNLNDITTNTQLIDLEFGSAVMLNQDFNKNTNMAKYPPHAITTNKGTNLKLAYRAGTTYEAQQYLLMVLVDWKQANINNESFQLINIEKLNKVGFGTLNLQVPNKTGEYEVVAFLIPNPFEQKTNDYYYDIATSTRFTLDAK